MEEFMESEANWLPLPLQPIRFARLYNCSGRTFEEWRALGRPSVPIGVLYIALGVVYLTTYLPFMLVFVKTNLLRHSCYKIMFLLGVIDCTCIPVGSFYCGWASIIGINYCMYPRLQCVMGSAAVTLWGAGSSTCMILALNRCLDLLNPRLASALFANYRTYLWFAVPLFFVPYFGLYHRIPIFNSVLHAFFYDPFLGTPERSGKVDSVNFPSTGAFWHNISVVVFLSVCYCVVCLTLYRRSKRFHAHQVSRAQIRITLQAIVICSVTFVAALTYVLMQIFPPPVWVVVTAHVMWLSSHGMVGLVYLVFNRTMRRAAIKLFCIPYSVRLERHYYNSNVGMAASLQVVDSFDIMDTQIRYNF